MKYSGLQQKRDGKFHIIEAWEVRPSGVSKPWVQKIEWRIDPNSLRISRLFLSRSDEGEDGWSKRLEGLSPTEVRAILDATGSEGAQRKESGATLLASAASSRRPMLCGAMRSRRDKPDPLSSTSSGKRSLCLASQRRVASRPRLSSGC